MDAISWQPCLGAPTQLSDSSPQLQDSKCTANNYYTVRKYFRQPMFNVSLIEMPEQYVMCNQHH